MKARAILGVPPSAGRKEIQQAFRQASLATHPDTNPDDEHAMRRFNLICCAYKFLTQGEACRELDAEQPPPEAIPDGEYRLDNPWGYWCWWRDKYFGQEK